MKELKVCQLCLTNYSSGAEAGDKQGWGDREKERERERERGGGGGGEVTGWQLSSL